MATTTVLPAELDDLFEQLRDLSDRFDVAMTAARAELARWRDGHTSSPVHRLAGDVGPGVVFEGGRAPGHRVTVDGRSS